MKITTNEEEIIVYEQVERYELDPYEASPPIYLVIDILKDTEKPDNYFPKIYRRNYFSIRDISYNFVENESTVPAEEDQQILVLDPHFEFRLQDMIGTTAEEVLEKTLKMIDDEFNNSPKK